MNMLWGFLDALPVGFFATLGLLAKGLVNVGSKEIQTLLSVGIHQSGVRYLCLRGDDVEVAVVISWAVFSFSWCCYHCSNR